MRSPENRNSWRSAIAEAAFMTGLERNGDVVQMASYAPLLAHADAWQWKPDAIWFDNFCSFGTPDYYVQKVFANNIGTRVVPVIGEIQGSLYANATLNERSHELILKTVNTTAFHRPLKLNLKGWTPMGVATVTTLQSDDLNAENDFERPTAVSPKKSTIEFRSSDISLELQPNSLTVYRTPIT